MKSKLDDFYRSSLIDGFKTLFSDDEESLTLFVDWIMLLGDEKKHPTAMYLVSMPEVYRKRLILLIELFAKGTLGWVFVDEFLGTICAKLIEDKIRLLVILSHRKLSPSEQCLVEIIICDQRFPTSICIIGDSRNEVPQSQ